MPDKVIAGQAALLPRGNWLCPVCLEVTSPDIRHAGEAGIVCLPLAIEVRVVLSIVHGRITKLIMWLLVSW